MRPQETLVAPTKEEFLRALSSFVLRAEGKGKGVNSLGGFVQLIEFSSLATANTQVIYGRNGTGKTHLLKAFHEYCEKNFEETKYFSAYVDFRDLDLGNSASEITVATLVLRFYERFMPTGGCRVKEFS